MNFLIVEDDSRFSKFLSENLSKYGKVFATDSFENALNLINSYPIDCAIIDQKLGEEIVGPQIALTAKQKGIGHVIAVTDFESDSELLLKTYENGVDDFVKKSNLKDHLEFFIRKIVRSRDLRKSILNLTKTVYLTKDQELIRSIEIVCDTYAPMEPIFIKGPSGSGKTLLGKLLKILFGLEGDLVELNCAELSDELIRSELFGHEKGAFTGADRQHIGAIERAHNGILFLDEIGDMSLSTQEKLLKVLEEKEFNRVGGNKKIKSNFLLVSATLKNLEDLVRQGKLRLDFYYRIVGKTICVKPISERKDDLKMLITHFQNKTPRSVYITPEVHEGLMNYSWPGNIRQLQKVMVRLSETKGGVVRLEHLRPFLISEEISTKKDQGLLTDDQLHYVKEHKSIKALFDNLEREILVHAHKEHNGNKTYIAKDYDVSRRKLVEYYKEASPEVVQ